MDTVTSGTLHDYPQDRFRVFVLDDADKSELHDAIELLNRQQAGRIGVKVSYLAREKTPGIPHYFKSGNLSFGTQETVRLGGSSECYAALDADTIASRSWLSMTVPHLVMQPELALVNLPQAVLIKVLFTHLS